MNGNYVKIWGEGLILTVQPMAILQGESEACISLISFGLG